MDFINKSRDLMGAVFYKFLSENIFRNTSLFSLQ